MHREPIGRWIPAQPPSETNPNVCIHCEKSPDLADSPQPSNPRGRVQPNPHDQSCEISRHTRAGLVASILLMLSVSIGCGADIELQPVAAWELYNRTGEIKGGMGLRGRYWFSDIGVEAQGLSLTPRDSIVDRSDLSVCYRLPIGLPRWTAKEDPREASENGTAMDSESERTASSTSFILSAGYGSNWEDHAHGPGIGAAVQYNRGKWFGEVGTRAIWEDYSKTLLTIGIGRKF